MPAHWDPHAARPVSADLHVTPQLWPDQVPQVAAAGYRTLINNRPDFEAGPDQPTSRELQSAARAAGLSYRHLPVPPSGHADADAREMAQLVRSLPKPVLAFCSTGKRSASLYEQGEALRGQP